MIPLQRNALFRRLKEKLAAKREQEQRPQADKPRLPAAPQCRGGQEAHCRAEHKLGPAFRKKRDHGVSSLSRCDAAILLRYSVGVFPVSFLKERLKFAMLLKPQASLI